MSNLGRNLTPTPFTPSGAPSTDQTIGQHIESDADASRKSQHHTLGNSRNQAAGGDHVHDGVNGKKLGLYQMTSGGGATQTSLVLTGAKGGNVALTNLIAMLKTFIDFTDNTT